MYLRSFKIDVVKQKKGDNLFIFIIVQESVTFTYASEDVGLANDNNYVTVMPLLRKWQQ